jgi:putative intracellular protease/amidase
MRLINKQLLLLVADGVEQVECDQLRRGFEEEGAVVFAITNQDYVTIETVFQGKRGHDVIIDIPFEKVADSKFDGLIIPDGLIAQQAFLGDERVLRLVARLNQSGVPIFASGTASDVLTKAGVNSPTVLVREGTPLRSFITQAVGILTDKPTYGYRPVIAA